MPSLQGAVRRITSSASRWGREVGILPVRPEDWTLETYERVYTSGRLRYLADLEEVTRYGVVASFITFSHTPPDVLDLGCGTGLLAQHLPPARIGQYIGIDFAPAAIEEASKLASERVRFEVGDALTMDFPPCDVVVLNEILYPLAERENLVDRLAGCLHSNGRVVTSIFRQPGSWQLWRLLDARFERLDLAEVKSSLAKRSWQVGYHRVRSD